MTAAEILRAAADLSQERQAQHGKSELNMKHLAAFLTAYVHLAFGEKAAGIVFQKRHAAMIMSLSKGVRTELGVHNPDDYVDGAAYFAMAGALADDDAAVAGRIVAEHPPASTGVKLPVAPYPIVGIGSWIPDCDRAKRA